MVLADGPLVPAWLMDTWWLALVGGVLLVAAVTDVRSGKIYNWLTYPAMVAGLALHALLGGLTGSEESPLGLAGSMAGLLVGFVPLLIAFLAGGLGAGDAKLMGAVGALGGWRFALMAMLYGFIVAVVMAVIVMVRRRIVKRTLFRVGHTVMQALLTKKPEDPAAPDSPTVPFGLALCIGAALAVIEVLVRGAGETQWLLGL